MAPSFHVCAELCSEVVTLTWWAASKLGVLFFLCPTPHRNDACPAFALRFLRGSAEPQQAGEADTQQQHHHHHISAGGSSRDTHTPTLPSSVTPNGVVGAVGGDGRSTPGLHPEGGAGSTYGRFLGLVPASAVEQAKKLAGGSDTSAIFYNLLCDSFTRRRWVAPCDLCVCDACVSCVCCARGMVLLASAGKFARDDWSTHVCCAYRLLFYLQATKAAVP